MTVQNLREEPRPADQAIKAQTDQTRVDMSIVLVCWNNKKYLDPCLKSLYESEINFTFDVIVVDNGSTDGSMEMLREKYPQVMIIENGGNLGLSKASNQGIEATNGEFAMLLNNDTIVNGKAFNAMVEFLKTHPEAGAVGGKLLNGDGSFQAGYARFSTLWEEFLIVTHIGAAIWPGYPSHLDTNTVKKVGWLSSACLLCRRSVLDKVGKLDEGYFIYGDEADLQYRFSKAGQPVYYLPDITTTHFGGKSMNRWGRRKMVYRGKLLFYKKNYGWLATTLLRIMVALATVVKLLYWGIIWLVSSKYREWAGHELSSNIDVIKLCLRLT